MTSERRTRPVTNLTLARDSQLEPDHREQLLQIRHGTVGFANQAAIERVVRLKDKS